MLSAPPASAKSASPSASACTAETIACAPEPQSRLTFIAGTRLRHARLHRRDPAQVHVARLGVDDVAEDHVADLPALDPGARQRLARGGGGEADRRDRARLPPKVPMAVRAPSRITMSLVMADRLPSWSR